jgi:HSP20 family protein
MTRKQLAPWRWGGLSRWHTEDHPMMSFRREIDKLHQDMDRLFKDFWRNEDSSLTMPGMWGPRDVMPRVDETEDDEGFHVKVELPGMDQKDVEVTLSDGMLTIRGEKKQEEEEKGKDFYRKERSFGSFRRVLPIPGEVDDSKIKASFEKGVLCIELPKSEEAQKKVKHISVEAA